MLTICTFCYRTHTPYDIPCINVSIRDMEALSTLANSTALEHRASISDLVPSVNFRYLRMFACLSSYLLGVN